MDTLRIVLSQGEQVRLGGFGPFEVLTDIRGERIPIFKGGKTFVMIPLSDAVLRLPNLNFKMDGKIKTAQNRRSNMKKGKIRTQKSDLKSEKTV